MYTVLPLQFLLPNSCYSLRVTLESCCAMGDSFHLLMLFRWLGPSFLSHEERTSEK